MENVTILLAFSGGLLAFISPCCLPLYPSFISYITGMSVNELKEKNHPAARKTILYHSIFFSIGFSLIYYVLGFSASTLGGFFKENQGLIRMLGGIFLVIMGLFLIGIIQPKFMLKEFRFKQKKRKGKYFNSFIVGLVFAAGWTPCIGPIFGTIMYANVINPAPLQTFLNVTAYSLGFCLPFVIMAFFIGKTRGILKYSAALMKIGGIIMVLLGILLYFDKMFYINMIVQELYYRLLDLFGLF
ncbi:cytochrome C biogenesis protein CcdA [Heyndrickxia sporothermodurans]|nr:cytochrome C biogenesis protein CcdA [Heyndrickxia sporothermodurans]